MSLFTLDGEERENLLFYEFREIKMNYKFFEIERKILFIKLLLFYGHGFNARNL